MKITITPTEKDFLAGSHYLGRLWNGHTDEGHEVVVAVSAVATAIDDEPANKQLSESLRGLGFGYFADATFDQISGQDDPPSQDDRDATDDPISRASTSLQKLVDLHNADDSTQALLTLSAAAISYTTGLLQRIQGGLNVDSEDEQISHEQISYAIALMEAFNQGDSLGWPQ